MSVSDAPYAHPIPSWPITSPLKTAVIANEMPVTVPTMPFARSRAPAGTSSVTHVDSAMPRIWAVTEPTRVTATSSQNHGLPMCSSSSVGAIAYIALAEREAAAAIAVVAISAVFLRWRSTNVPKIGPRTADEMLNAPPMTPVATTDRVSR